MEKNFWVVPHDFDKKWGIECKGEDDMNDILVSNSRTIYDTEFEARIDAVICEIIYNEQKLNEIQTILNNIQNENKTI